LPAFSPPFGTRTSLPARHDLFLLSSLVSLETRSALRQRSVYSVDFFPPLFFWGPRFSFPPVSPHTKSIDPSIPVGKRKPGHPRTVTTDSPLLSGVV